MSINVPARALKREIKNALEKQGYDLCGNVFALRSHSREALRRAHTMARKERLTGHAQFIADNRSLIEKRAIDGARLAAANIDPVLREVTPSSENETLYKWWNFVWWSLPYERAYGRQMRYVVWDRHHEAVIGLLGLQSPILSWSPRDDNLNIPADNKDFWVNQSMSIQRLGAVPPYNGILGGKLVAMLAASDQLRQDFARKYKQRETVMRARVIPPRLLFATTTGAFGKSSIYNRLKSGDGETLAEYIGDSRGTGSFHIPHAIYLRILDFLESEGVNVARGYGNGPSRKMRLISDGLNRLGYRNGNNHGIKRAIYLFSYVKNLHQHIARQHSRPRWAKRDEKDLTSFWKERWALPRLERLARKNFVAADFIDKQLAEIRGDV